MSLILNILVLLIPIFIAYYSYKITRINKIEKTKEGVLNLYILIGSLIIIFGNLILWFINNQESRAKDIKIDTLMTQNIQLLESNKGLFTGNLEIFKGQKELLDENIKISEQNKSLSNKVDELKEIVVQKDYRIAELENQVNNLKIAAPKIGLDGSIEASPYVKMASEFSDGINNARKLFDEGKFNEAYDIAQNLSQKKNDFGLAYFIMGTVKAAQANYSESENLLKKAIDLGLPNDDLSWAYHNLGVIYLHKNFLLLARDYVEKALKVSPNMENSKSLLKDINRYLGN
jgi:tetratricopeptide (TPR) repeat protein